MSVASIIPRRQVKDRALAADCRNVHFSHFAEKMTDTITAAA